MDRFKPLNFSNDLDVFIKQAIAEKSSYKAILIKDIYDYQSDDNKKFVTLKFKELNIDSNHPYDREFVFWVNNKEYTCLINRTNVIKNRDYIKLLIPIDKYSLIEFKTKLKWM